MTLTVENLTKHFVAGGVLERMFGGREVVRAVDGVSFTVERGRTLGVVGESGCGKTTLARVVAHLYRPTSGRVLFDGHDITALGDREFRRLRRRIQMVFQDPLGSLNPRRTVGRIVETPLRVHGLDGDRRRRTEDVLRAVGLDPGRFADRYPHQLSGGQAQRVAIARALVLDPELIVADEPVSALDVSVQAQIINLMQRLQAERGLTYVFISHDLSVVRHLTDDVLVMYLGKAVEQAPTEQLFANPHHPYTEALLRAVPRTHGRNEPVRLAGHPPSPSNPPAGCPFHTRCHAKIGEVCEQHQPRTVDVLPGHEVTCHLHTETRGAVHVD
ncbi:MAG: ABC transporter ATP-binding protein [Actinomycetes bacterium]